MPQQHLWPPSLVHQPFRTIVDTTVITITAEAQGHSHYIENYHDERRLRLFRHYLCQIGRDPSVLHLR